ncbi:hypothetical protein CU097_010172 [Rhizopus azygosporus]|uniref:Uncharacterized protein n=1 Tax=Rhizopus azygosporus TaxID=86630 RepID=A0A367KAZ2_RHIAZ|nr:hypothetical protein CU097_010172 [Rhizopus azygosporus]
MSFQIVLREGIRGGFVGPTTRYAVQIQGDKSGATVTQSTLKPDSRTDYNTMAGGASFEDLANLVQTLKDQLSKLPTEQPPGSEDIYDLDTSIIFACDDFEWCNGGCAQGQSSVQATEEQKEKFKELVELLKGVGQNFAVSAA